MIKIKLEIERFFEPDCEGCDYYRRTVTPTDVLDLIEWECTCDDLVEECPEVLREGFNGLKYCFGWDITAEEAEHV